MSAGGRSVSDEKKYKGVRPRRWGKWVSEIRVPGTEGRLWLGSYSTPEAAAVAHDVAFYCLRRPSSLTALNFPSLLPPYVNPDMSPKSVQKAATDAGMAIDDQMTSANGSVNNEMMANANDASGGSWERSEGRELEGLSISVEDYL
ncbi:ERF020 protein [Hibiscus syriacus]|uniref:ERF020 protein n=1 Tax=Hibiscus syriacus TaxID=106335 RepID=A0A6A2YRQ0_HIBSY|nr:ethylene-responsive transcription factor ERF020-like [Hibiscus syriacus]KAE8682118.1 ERF020 protein [Hibiscus syriacus]